MNAINEVKMLVAKKGTTLTFLAEYLTKNSDKKYSIDTLSKKLRANTIRYSEMKLIAQALDMEIIIQDRT
ncbi:MAG: hypothetical protein IKU37_07370 [Candidatus Gastranaerophilales bacterium]|nr:hypothetical protein [Candidatus Gastranaerophilales bacterium]